eukprot:g8295.t1
MLRKTCDFCYKRKRPCDGLAQRYCSFCAAKNQAECHYRRRRAPHRPSDTSLSCPTSATVVKHPNPERDGVGGRSFWRTGSDAAASAAALSEKREIFHEASVGVGDGGEAAVALPLKRGRFSASPATGLVGLQENEFLGDFFGALDFLALTDRSTVRDAMVRIMLAGESTQHPHHCHHHDKVGAPFQSSPIRCRERVREGKDARHSAFGEMSTNVEVAYQSNALAAELGTGVLPRDSSTCMMWCAVALGALVRGHPLPKAGRYVELAEDSLRACRDDASLDTARAYVSTAILHDFLGDRVKTHEYLIAANSIVDGLPPEDIPRGFYGLLEYVGMAWTLDTELASAEDVTSYWENASPIWELSESVMEQDVSGLVLSVCVRMNQPFIDETGVQRVLCAKESPPSAPPGSSTKPVAHRPSNEQPEEHDAAQSDVEGSPRGMLSEEVTVAVLEEGQLCLPGIISSTENQKGVLPQMLRVQECIESSKMHLGIGGLLYYGNLAYLQAINDLEPGRSFLRAVGVILRYPGICRYKTWLWAVHSYLFLLAATQRRCKYEEMRAAYNSVLPPESKPAPQFEECKKISDICDHAYCRKTVTHMLFVLQGIRSRPTPRSL